MHDTGRSGWWLLIGLIPLIGTIVLIVFFVKDSEPGANQHGPSPKAVTVTDDSPIGSGYAPTQG